MTLQLLAHADGARGAGRFRLRDVGFYAAASLGFSSPSTSAWITFSRSSTCIVIVMVSVLAMAASLSWKHSMAALRPKKLGWDILNQPDGDILE